MKLATAILIALITCTAFAQVPAARAGADGGLKVGAPAPNFTLPLIANGSGAFDLRQQRGRGVYINFFASWCDPCKREARTLESITREFASRNVAVVGVAVLDTTSGVRSFVARHRLPYPIAFDQTGRVGAAYRLRALPLHVFIAPNGSIKQVVAGGPIPSSVLRAGLASIAR